VSSLEPAETRGIPVGVIAAALATGVGILPVVRAFEASPTPQSLFFGAGWIAFGIAAALLIDRSAAPRVGLLFVLFAVVPAVVAVAGVLPDGRVGWVGVDWVWQHTVLILVVVMLATTAVAVDRAGDRVSRRRLTWIVAFSCVLMALISAASQAASDSAFAVVVMLGLWAYAGVVTRLVLTDELRPIIEPVIDVAGVLTVLATGGALGLLFLYGATRIALPGAAPSAVFVALVTVLLAWPTAVWTRRRLLEHRYGTGALTPADVSAITADLHSQSDPRALVGKAADMVAAASGHRQVRLVLGSDDPEAGPPWLQHPLVVGGERVGTMLIEARHPEGPEPRQERIVAQLEPTVALVVRAVGLAVEAEHARADVARERDAERSRILGDLHDGVGPVLAGMGMRVQAELRARPTPMLEALGRELAECRGDLRRIVSGLTPRALADADLDAALRQLANGFDVAGITVELATSINAEPAPDVAVAVYRSVAEGITNALRHAQASRIDVAVRTSAHGVEASVTDDGCGGPIAPGVGLTSLRKRAEDLGGSLIIEPGASGTRLRLVVPLERAA
jgi:signal transduction histidine kinase